MGLAQSPFGRLMISAEHLQHRVEDGGAGGQKNVNDFILNPQGQPVPQSARRLN